MFGFGGGNMYGGGGSNPLERRTFNSDGSRNIPHNYGRPYGGYGGGNVGWGGGFGGIGYGGNANAMNLDGFGKVLYNGMRTVQAVQTVGVLADVAGNAVGAVRGVGHTQNGAYQQRRGYGNAMEGNGNQSEMYRNDTRAALDGQRAQYGYDDNGRRSNNQNSYAGGSNVYNSKGNLKKGSFDPNWSAEQAQNTKEIKSLERELNNVEKELAKDQKRYQNANREKRQDRLEGEINDGLTRRDEIINELNDRKGLNMAQPGQPGQGNVPTPQAEAQEFAFLMLDANRAQPGSTQQLDLLARAKAHLDNLSADGKVYMPATQVQVGTQQNPVTINFEESTHNPKDLMVQVSQALAAKGGGQTVPGATIEQVTRGLDQASRAHEPIAITATAPTEKIAAAQREVDAVSQPAASATTPAGNGQRAKIYNGVKDAPPVYANQVGDIQRALLAQGYDVGPKKDDGKWGDKTQQAFLKACRDAGVDPKGVDLTQPGSADVLISSAQSKKSASVAPVAPELVASPEPVEAPVVAATPTPEATTNIPPLVAAPSTTTARVIGESTERSNFLTAVASGMGFSGGEDQIISQFEQKYQGLAGGKITADGKLDAAELKFIGDASGKLDDYKKMGASVLFGNEIRTIEKAKPELDALLAKEGIAPISGVSTDGQHVAQGDQQRGTGGAKEKDQSLAMN